MNKFSGMHAIIAAILIGCIVLLGKFLFIPAAIASVRSSTDILHSFMDITAAEIESVQQQLDSLKSVEKALIRTGTGQQTETQWFSHIHSTLEHYKLSATSLRSSGIQDKQDYIQAQYILTFNAPYHTTGFIVNELETGPFICSVDNLTLINKNPGSGPADVTLQVTFYQGIGQ